MAIAALTAPAAASAATYTVATGEGTCAAPADTSCGTLAAAASAVGTGDTVNVSPGTYAESPSFGAPNVTITGSTTAPGVVVSGTISFATGGATPSVLEKVVVAAPAAGGPAVSVSGSAGVAVRDAILIGSAGPGMAITSGQANAITRSTVLAGAADGIAVDLQVGATATSLVLDSSVLSGGGGGVGLNVKTGVNLLGLGAAGASITARHVTIAGAATAVSFDARSASVLLSPSGGIAATVTDSIVLGATQLLPNPGPGVGGPNTTTLALTRTDQATPAAQLFVDTAKRNYHLRADAPAIDKGQVTAGDSPADLDGQPRTAGPASDLGADEFHNSAPTAQLEVRTATPRAEQPVAFDASKSADREAGFGGGIAQYLWDFGDGKTETTTTPAVTHIYAAEGTVAVTLTVVDRQGLASAPVTAPVSLTDGTPPAVVVSRPKAKAKVRLRNARTKKRTPPRFQGTAKDKSGVARVVLTIERITATTNKKRCMWLDKKKGLVKADCDKPVLINAKLKDGKWTYAVASTISLSAGKYRVSAFGVDGGGAFGNSAPAKNRIVSFTLVA